MQNLISENYIQVKNLSVSYGSIKAVKGLSFDIQKGQITTLIGSNGAGKTSTLNALVGLLPSNGEVILFRNSNKTDLNKMTSKERLVQKVALSPEGRGVFPNLSVFDNLMLGAYLNKNSQEIQSLIQQQYDFFPKLAERRNQLAGTLSGGEQQMLAISRALMSQPDFLFLDEPSLGLAPVIIELIFDKFVQLKSKGLGILLVEQNASLALSISDKAYVIETGEILFSGPGRELLKDDRVIKAYLS